MTLFRPCQFKNDPNPCELCKHAYTEDCKDMRSETLKREKPLEFKTAKEITEEETYNKIVKSLRKQFKIDK